MTQVSEQHADYLRSLIQTARKHPGLWVIPLASAILIAVMMAFIGPKKWDADQSFLVREELIGRIVSPGRFESLDRMKTAQEVIQETSRRPSVLRRVLAANGEDDPSASDIEMLQGAISFYAPGGAELGKTEILTMNVKSSSAKKAKELVSSLFEETRAEIRNMRTRKAESMLKEAGGSVELATERLSETSQQIRTVESDVGGDLSELRGLNEPFSGGGELRRNIATIQAEIRSARQSEQEAIQMIEYLEGLNPDQLLATPRELLDSQPALSELKTRLIEAQVEQSNTGGIYSPMHPRFQARANSVVDIRSQITAELKTALVGLRSQQKLAQQQVEMMNKQISKINGRITDLASMRVDYGQMVNELELRNEELRSAHKEYAQAESILRASKTIDLITPLDDAAAGIRPLGPNNKTVLIAATIAGLLIGLGLIMMVTPTPELRNSNGSTGYTAPIQVGQHRTSMPANETQKETLRERMARKVLGMDTSQPASAPNTPNAPKAPVNIPVEDISTTTVSTGFVIPDLGDSMTGQPPRSQP